MKNARDIILICLSVSFLMNEIEQFNESFFVVQCGDPLFLLRTSLEARLLQKKTLLRRETKPSDLLLSQSLLIQVSKHSLKGAQV